IASPARPVSDPGDINSSELLTFRHGEASMSTSDSLVKAAFLHLSEIWPSSVAFDELLKQSVSHLTSARPQDSDSLEQYRQSLASDLLRAYGANLVQCRTAEDSFVTAVSDHPKASDLARYQSMTGDLITNQLHETLSVDGLTRHLLPL